MATMARIFSLYSERFGSSLEDRFEWGSVFMLSYKTEQMRKMLSRLRSRETDRIEAYRTDRLADRLPCMRQAVFCAISQCPQAEAGFCIEG